jgi:hypothetical protein
MAVSLSEKYSITIIYMDTYFIIIFTLLRFIFGICAIPINHDGCSLESKLIDSIAAILQSPRSNPVDDIDIIERVVSLPLVCLGIANAWKRGTAFFSGESV